MCIWIRGLHLCMRDKDLSLGLVLYKVNLIYKMLKTTGVLMLSFSLSPVDWQNCMKVNESLKSKCFSIPLPLICILVLCTTYHGYMNLYWVSELQQHFYIQSRIRFTKNIVIYCIVWAPYATILWHQKGLFLRAANDFQFKLVNCYGRMIKPISLKPFSYSNTHCSSAIKWRLQGLNVKYFVFLWC